MKKIVLAALALFGLVSANAAEVVSTHTGTFNNHFTGLDTECTVKEWSNGLWTAENAYGQEGMTLVWYVNENNAPIFINNSASVYDYYYYPDGQDWLAIYNDASAVYSAYEVTTYNGSDVWFSSYDSSWENWGYDAIYWDLPEVTATYTGTYENGFKEEPYEVTVEELSNGMVRIIDFYGYTGYPLYVDLSGSTPVIANAAADDDSSEAYVTAGWYNTANSWTYVNVYADADATASYKPLTVEGKVIKLPVVVKADDIEDVNHVDVITWDAPEVVSTHEGTFVSHFNDNDPTSCVVTEYSNGLWTADNAYGYETMSLAWSVNENGTIKFDYSDPNAAYAGYYFDPNSADSDYVWIYNKGWSAYEVTTFNGSDIWFYSYNSNWGNGGYDAIYWDQPELLGTYTATYKNGLNDEPYTVYVDELGNGMIRVNDFYGVEGYPLYVDLSGNTPVIANADEDGAVLAGWAYTDTATGAWANIYVYADADQVVSITRSVLGNKLQLPVKVVFGENNIANTDLLIWNAPDFIQAHEGQYYSHLDDAYTPCVVNEYEGNIWSVANACGVEGLDIAWQVVDGDVQFKDYASTWGNYATYNGNVDGTDYSYYVWNTTGGYSAYEVTSFNGSDIWFWCYDYRGNDGGGYDAIYWDLPTVEEVYVGTYENALSEEPYDVNIEKLSNGLVRVKDFYGYTGYPLYIDMANGTPVIANLNDYGYVDAGWYYTSDDYSTWNSLYVYPNDTESASYTEGSLGKFIYLPVIVKSDEDAEGVAHRDVISWDLATGIQGIGADNADDAECVFYNLQGLRVNNPANGLFIKVQGNKVSKVIIK